MDKFLVIPTLVAFMISVAVAPFIIPFLRKLKVGQTERVDGVQSHLKKAGTPTMGGMIFLLATTVTSLFYVKSCPEIIPVLFLTLGFGLIGFLDDFLKVVLRRSDGLLPKQKMALQIVVTGVFAPLYGYFAYSADPVYEWLLSGYWLAGSAADVFCSDRYCKRCELYGRSGWPCLQRHGDGSHLFYRCSHA